AASQGRTPRYCAASTTVSSCSADIRAFLTATSKSVTAPERCRWTASRNRRVRGLSGLRDLEILGVRAVRLEHELAQAILGRWILDRSQQREATSLTVGRELARRERDVLPGPVAPCPDGKADQPQAIELAAGEMEFGVRELAGRHVTVANDLHEDIHNATS